MMNINIDLINKAKEGDKKAFEILLDDWNRDMFLIAKTKLKQLTDIEDAVQETVLEMYMGIKRLKDPEKFRSWMGKILVNNCYDIIKNNRQYDIMLDEEWLETYDGIFEAINNSSAEFFELIDFLDEEEQTMLLMKYFQGYTYGEIGKIVKKKESAVKMQIHRIKERVVEELGEDFFGRSIT